MISRELWISFGNFDLCTDCDIIVNNTIGESGESLKEKHLDSDDHFNLRKG